MIRTVFLALFFGCALNCTHCEENFRQASEHEIAAVKRFISVCQRIRLEKSRNMHFVGFEDFRFEASADRYRTIKKIEFWTRDDRFFRLDQAILESDSHRIPLGKRFRQIAQPEGYVALRAESASDSYRIIRWGSAEEGWDFIFGDYCTLGGVRFDRIYYADVFVDTLFNEPIGIIDEDRTLTKMYGNQCTIKDLQLSDDAKVLKLDYVRGFSWQSKQASTDAILVCDVENGVVREFKAKDYLEGSFIFSRREQLDFDFKKYGPYPVSYRREVDHDDGSIDTIHFRLEQIDWDKITPLGVFSIEAQGVTSLQPQTVWARRIWIILSALLIFAIVYLVKRARYRANS